MITPATKKSWPLKCLTGQVFSGNEVHLYNSLLVGNSSESSSNSISNWHDDSITYNGNSVIETEDGTYTVTDYVNDDAVGAGNGSSWKNAYNDLQDALAVAASGSQIWVTAGTYKPTDGTDREASFVMIEDVEIYGGFTGTESSLEERNWETQETILSGDIGIENDTADNSYHVLFGASDGTIDGFTIEDGRADGMWFNSRGGGLLCYDANSPAVNNCIFINNYAVEGGAITAYNDSAPTITDCTVASNSAERATGILLHTGPDTQVTGAQISGTTFSGNSANDRGGAVYIDYGAWPSFTGCTFNSNTAVGNGGAVYVDNNSSQLSTIETWFDICDFEGNVSQKRGGAFAIYEGTVHFSFSTISNNSAETGGGGIALDYNGSYDDDGSSTISGNSSTTGVADIDGIVWIKRVFYRLVEREGEMY